MHRIVKLASLAGVAAIVSASQAVTLYNTGVGLSGLDAYGSIDSHFTVTRTGGTTPAKTDTHAYIVRPYDRPNGTRYWIGDDTYSGSMFDDPNQSAASRWITPFQLRDSQGLNSGLADPNIDPTVDGVYRYTYTLTLTASEASWLNANGLSGRWSSDNHSSVTFGSSSLSYGSSTAYTAWNPFTFNSGFTAGNNYIYFDVTNERQVGGNPTGLRVEWTTQVASDPVPEPFTASIVAGALGIAAIRKRRKSS